MLVDGTDRTCTIHIIIIETNYDDTLADSITAQLMLPYLAEVVFDSELSDGLISACLSK